MTYPGYQPTGPQGNQPGGPYYDATATSGTTPASRRAGLAVLISAILLLLLGAAVTIGVSQVDANQLVANNPDVPPGQEGMVKGVAIAMCSGCSIIIALPLFILFPFVRKGRKGALITAIVLSALMILALAINLVGGIVQLVNPEINQGPALDGTWLTVQIILSGVAALASLAALILSAMALRSPAGDGNVPPGGYYAPQAYPGQGYAQQPSPPQQQGWGSTGGGYPGSDTQQEPPAPDEPGEPRNRPDGY